MLRTPAYITSCPYNSLTHPLWAAISLIGLPHTSGPLAFDWTMALLLFSFTRLQLKHSSRHIRVANSNCTMVVLIGDNLGGAAIWRRPKRWQQPRRKQRHGQS
jgi:hypothetical protein